MTAAGSAVGRPEDARAHLRAFVFALHQAYCDAAAALPSAGRAALPLLAAEQVTVVVAAARQLHVLATADQIGGPGGPEPPTDQIDGLRWSVRFYDPVVLPELGRIGGPDDPAAAQLRQALGVGSVLYHLSVAPGGGLGPHHAMHAGTGLANQHAAQARASLSRPDSSAVVAGPARMARP